MLGEEQAQAYADADFEQPHQHFITLFRELFPDHGKGGVVLDLGCGAADISRRFARAYPHSLIHGVDGSEAMLQQAAEMLHGEGLDGRVELICTRLPTRDLPRPAYDVVISNSLLHHLKDPQVLWNTAKRFALPRAPILVMDLMRPENDEEAQALTERYVGEEPQVLRQDFANSLRAAYRPWEVEAQLREARLRQFSLEVISDRHLIVWGRMGPKR